MARKLRTLPDVINALGGIQAVAELTGQTYSNAANWNSWRPTFPPSTYVVMMNALIKRGFTAPYSLWRMIPPHGRS